MSLTKILRSSDAKRFLRGLIRPPEMKLRPPPRVEPTKLRGRVGTAVDYAIRFGLEVRGGYPHQQSLIAEYAPRHVAIFGPSRLVIPARDRLIEALYGLCDLSAASELSEAVAVACLKLATLDESYRAGQFDGLTWEPDEAAVSEVQAIYAMTPWAQLRPRQWGALNPRFSEGSERVGGADADLVVDGRLIDIKTVAKTRPSLQYIRQLVAYALLGNRFGVSGAPNGAQIETLGLYFARAGHLFQFPLAVCIDDEHRDVVLEYLLAIGDRINGSSRVTRDDS